MLSNVNNSITVQKCEHNHLLHPLCDHYSTGKKVATLVFLLLLNVVTLGAPLVIYGIYKVFSKKTSKDENVHVLDRIHLPQVKNVPISNGTSFNQERPITQADLNSIEQKNTPVISPIQNLNNTQSINSQVLRTNLEELIPVPGEKKDIQIRPLPDPQQGVIKNGYGEYLIFRIKSDGKKEAISDEEYQKIFATIENCRAIKRNQISDDYHYYLKNKIQEQLGSDIQIAFIPRTLYEIIFLKKCIKEDLKKHECSHAMATGILFGLQEQTENKKDVIDKAMEKGFWQQCLFEDKDYIDQFSTENTFDYRYDHLKLISSKLNRVSLGYFEDKCVSNEGFTYEQIKNVQNTIVSFFKDLHNPESTLHADAQKITGFTTFAGVAKEFSEETTQVRGRTEQFPMGIATERHEQIVEKAIQLECSAEAINSLILYRGGNFALDALTRKQSDYETKSPLLANSLSFGSLYAGALYDGGATAFHYMRNRRSDAQAFVVPIKKQQEGNTPFHVSYVHPLIQLMSKGEIFHFRTKIWELNPQEHVLGFFGIAQLRYSGIKDCCKTKESQEKIEKQFQKYKSKAYLLAERAAS